MIRYAKFTRFGEAFTLALALALGAGGALSGPAQAQERLPSVNEYRLPSPAASPRPRAQGPVDGTAPVVIAPPSAQSAPDSPAPAATASKPAPKPKPSQAARAPAPPPSASPSAQASASQRPATQSIRPASPKQAESAAATAPARQASATPAPAPATAADLPPATTAPAPSAAPIDWHVHSAAKAANGASGNWLWPTVAAFLLGAAAMLLIQQMLRRKRAATASASAADRDLPAEPVAPPVTSAPPMPPAPMMPPAALPTAPEPLDLLSIMAEPEHAEAVPVAAQPSLFAVPAALGEPLALELSARRLSATLMNTVLIYELTVSNTGPDAIRSIIIGGDMIGAHASLPSRAQLELSGNNIVPLHTIAALAPGESVVIKGEFKLALTAITPIRSGNAALFIPLARFRLEAIGKSGLPFAVSRTFVVGEDQDRPGAALRPFRLDLGPRLYSQIGQRELALSA